MNERNVAKEWFNYGREKKDDPFTQFIMQWIAFNWLYSLSGGYSERERIRNFSENYKEKLSKYHAFDTKAYLVLSEGAISDGRTGSIGKNQTSVFSEMIESKTIAGLMLTMYQIRCNLFHGSKSLSDERDNAVVCAAAEILDGYLNAFLFE